MILLYAEHYFEDEEKFEAFVLYSSFVIAVAAAGFEEIAGFGVLAFVLPAERACVAKRESLRMALALKPVYSSAVLTTGIVVSQLGDLQLAGNIEGCTVPVCRLQAGALSWRCSSG